MSTHEIREKCLQIEGLMDKLKRFLDWQKQEILKDIRSSPYSVISVTPIFVGTEIVDIRDTQLRALLTGGSNRPSHSVPFGELPRPTLNGLKSKRLDHEASVELFRNGHLELRPDILDLDLSAPFPLADKQEAPVFSRFHLRGIP
jgi:hypothetical protein